MTTTVLTRKEPVYQQLAGLLETMIRSNSLRAGDRVPSVRHFSRQQRVSVPTALQAYATLEMRGLIAARPKSGFFVRAQQADFVREPNHAATLPKVTDLTGLDPLDSMLSDHSNPRLVPLGAAVPSGELLPAEKLARAMGAIARKLGARSIAYDMAPGSEILRREIARRSLEYGCSLKPDDFIITNGGTEALALALRATCEPGDTVAIESPTYYGLVDMLRELRLQALPIRMDGARGLDLDALENSLRRTRVAACVVIPNFNNPTGSLMPDENKRRLLEILAPRKIPVIEDDIYGDLQHEGARPRCVKTFDRDGSVLLCSSFSKTLAPGYRIGYIAAGSRHDRVLRLKKTSTLAGATLPALAVADFLRNGGYDRYLRSLRQKYRHQVARMREAIVETFPEDIGLSRPQGGFVLWCELPAKVNSVELFRQARAAEISIAPGPLFSAQGCHQNYIRLNCGHPWNAQIERSIGILGHLVKRLQGRPS
jgi:DNA-binding transcriptional MocR family regulator